MDVERFLDELKRDPKYAGQIVHVETIPAREAQRVDLPEDLLPGVARFLDTLGVCRT